MSFTPDPMSQELPPWISASGYEAMLEAVDDDITAFGEAVRDLELALDTGSMEEEVHRRYLRVLDEYESAKRARDQMVKVNDARPVTEVIEAGRFEVAWLRARADGRERPERRAPCFFDPQHGPSSTTVAWAPFGGATREVPACTADAERVADGAEPRARELFIDGRRVPYWEAGPALAPWVIGYYARYGLTRTAYAGTRMASLVSGW